MSSDIEIGIESNPFSSSGSVQFGDSYSSDSVCFVQIRFDAYLI